MLQPFVAKMILGKLKSKIKILSIYDHLCRKFVVTCLSENDYFLSRLLFDPQRRYLNCFNKGSTKMSHLSALHCFPFQTVISASK